MVRNTSLSANRRLLVKDREVLDNTGTLITGVFTVTDIGVLDGHYSKVIK